MDQCMHSGKQKDFQIFLVGPDCYWSKLSSFHQIDNYYISSIIIPLLGPSAGHLCPLIPDYHLGDHPFGTCKVWRLVSLTAVFLAGVPARCLPSANRG